MEPSRPPAAGAAEEPVVEVIEPVARGFHVASDGLVVAHAAVEAAHRAEYAGAVIVDVIAIALQSRGIAAAAEPGVDGLDGALASRVGNLHTRRIQRVDEEVGIADRAPVLAGVGGCRVRQVLEAPDA